MKSVTGCPNKPWHSYECATLSSTVLKMLLQSFGWLWNSWKMFWNLLWNSKNVCFFHCLVLFAWGLIFLLAKCVCKQVSDFWAVKNLLFSSKYKTGRNGLVSLLWKNTVNYFEINLDQSTNMKMQTETHCNF